MLRRTLLLTGSTLGATALGVAALTGTSPAHAATQAPFTPQALDAAREANKPILIAVHADWCPICSKQRPIIQSLMQTPEFKDLVILVVDYDTQKDVLKTLNVTKQSTLIALHGKAERARSVGITAREEIHTLMAQTKA